MSTLKASEIIEFIDSFELSVKSIEVSSNYIAFIRSHFRFIYNELFETDDSDVAAKLRLELLKLQSSPGLPSNETLSACGLVNNDLVSRAYGKDIANACLALDKLFRSIEGMQSPLLNQLIKIVEIELQSIDLTAIKIWCHKNEKSFFLEAFSRKKIEISNENFIHSLAEYRESKFFEVLLKVGPLRRSGWNSTPNVILSAPRYKRLIRVVWSGMNDESEYQSDVLLGSKKQSNIVLFEHEIIEENIPVLPEITNASIPIDTNDDFLFLMQRKIAVSSETIANLLEFENDSGVLIRPGGKRLIFCSREKKPIKIKLICELEPGEYFIFHNIHSDLGSEKIELEKTTWAKIWKKALKKQHDIDQVLLINKMRSAGINLKDLDGAVRRWTRMEGSVITGPQTREHFRLLIESVLIGCMDSKLWSRAWKEIQDSNVKAMQNGMLEHDITNEQLISDLMPYVEELKYKASSGDDFYFALPSSSSLSGVVRFSRILDVSSGFKCPNEKLNVVENIADLEIYRCDIKEAK